LANASRTKSVLSFQSAWRLVLAGLGVKLPIVTDCPLVVVRFVKSGWWLVHFSRVVRHLGGGFYLRGLARRSHTDSLVPVIDRRRRGRCEARRERSSRWRSP